MSNSCSESESDFIIIDDDKTDSSVCTEARKESVMSYSFNTVPPYQTEEKNSPDFDPMCWTGILSEDVINNNSDHTGAIYVSDLEKEIIPPVKLLTQKQMSNFLVSINDEQETRVFQGGVPGIDEKIRSIKKNFK